MGCLLSDGEENNIVDLIISYPKLRQMVAEIKEEAVVVTKERIYKFRGKEVK